MGNLEIQIKIQMIYYLSGLQLVSKHQLPLHKRILQQSKCRSDHRMLQLKNKQSIGDLTPL